MNFVGYVLVTIETIKLKPEEAFVTHLRMWLPQE
jgi:hypothetical protein